MCSEIRLTGDSQHPSPRDMCASQSLHARILPIPPFLRNPARSSLVRWSPVAVRPTGYFSGFRLTDQPLAFNRSGPLTNGNGKPSNRSSIRLRRHSRNPYPADIWTSTYPVESVRRIHRPDSTCAIPQIHQHTRAGLILDRLSIPFRIRNDVAPTRFNPH